MPLLDSEFRQMGYRNLKDTAAGKCATMKFIFTTGLVFGLDDSGYRGRYCYETETEAFIALMLWDGTGDPQGPWIKYKGVGGERLGPGAKSNEGA
jgi:hypothetical protein